MLDISRQTVGAFRSNCYLLKDEDQGTAVLVDPGAEPETILQWIGDINITNILITHGHADHVGALEQVRRALNCPVGGHAMDAEEFDLSFDFTLNSGSTIDVGIADLVVYEIPGHTPGSVAFAIREDDFERAIVGDAIFPGGPGHTRSQMDLKRLLDALERTVFTWPDEVMLFPGHGDPTTVGAEREAFERFRSNELAPDLFGDVTWR